MNYQGKMNSLVPLGVPGANVMNNIRSNVSNLNKKFTEVVANTQKNINTAVSSTGLPGGWMTALAIFAALVGLFLFILSYYSQEVKQGYEQILSSIRGFLGYEQEPLPPPLNLTPPPGEDVLEKAVPPQQETLPEKEATKPMVEKILPMISSSEVFNVSKNSFTYYDAEPLCRALGAELATYDQVKQAWEKGADWCNYGWVKGQTAVYPTQRGTYDKLQAGPVDQRTACGVPGLNGGYFDNPELRFGVNCYGPKPSQSEHDAAATSRGAALTPEALEIEKKVAQFRSEAASVGIMPFNTEKWAST